MKKMMFVVGLLLAFLFGMLIFGYTAEAEDKTVSAEIQQAPVIKTDKAVLIDARTGEVLYEKNKDRRGYPASTTKIMTGMLTLEICREQGVDLQDKLTVAKEAAGVEGSSLYLKAGEERTIENLLYGTMLRSGNDGATALACGIGGNQKHFVQRMNDRAAELHCTDTHFSNPTGLYDPEHYTTAADLAEISRYAMKNPEFRKIVAAKKWKGYENKNKTLFEYRGGNGVKIGFTKKSGRTLVASAKRKKVELICVVLDDPDWFTDAYRLMDYGFQLKGVTK